jgi:hypothetical protein
VSPSRAPRLATRAGAKRLPQRGLQTVVQRAESRIGQPQRPLGLFAQEKRLARTEARRKASWRFVWRCDARGDLSAQ